MRPGRGAWRIIAGAFAFGVLALVAAPAAVAQKRDPAPELNAGVELLPRPCAYEGGDRLERATYTREGWSGPDYVRYPGACQRLRFVYGPIVVKPGQNDVLDEPVTIQKPLVDGYITRFKPNLVRTDGSVPPLEQVHLHHMSLLPVTRQYGNPSIYGAIGLPAFGSGEEKTITLFPRGYGMPVRGTDGWGMLYMIHSAISQPTEVYVTYDVDFVRQEDVEAAGLRPAYPLWLDVRPDAPSYPVFNTQRGFGGPDGRCSWPREKCAAMDPWGQAVVGQGQPGNGAGQDYKLPDRGDPLGPIEHFTGGTLVSAGGHIHPGGVTNELDVVRPGRTEVVRRRVGRRWRRVRRKRESVRVYTGEAQYWDRGDPTKAGGPPTSWDFSEKVVGLPEWGIRLEPGDVLRSNATYDTTRQSSYENMGIVETFIAPDDPDDRPTAPGVDPFSVPVDRSAECRSRGLRARRGPRLCDKGHATHGHLRENENFSGPEGGWDARTGTPTDRVGIVDFLYAPGDLTTISMTGVPTVELGTSLTFHNADAHSIFHTVTSCDFPCKGGTGTAFPVANGRTSTGRTLDFDSGDLGFGNPTGPAKQTPDWNLEISRVQGFQPGEVVTYYCRIHPGMRGAFEVTE
ncbi:MAG TPA: hypothetical protein VF520_14660 [Thermoleophilaceae bacterium]|jgi:plastocyanin